MSQPLTMTARRAKVAQLLAHDPGMSARAIAAKLGVGKDTIRRDMDALRAADAPVEPPAPLNGDVLVLALDDGLRQALAVLRARLNAPDNEEQNHAAARAAIRATADAVLEAHPELAPSST
ncbi:helix-turn-helix domain-containing protein [Streptomyces sp. NPDC001508]|uniref:helix-turn-helix domain-containing protein n=1 Tax=Streptomyces sp. NPDC001508 TaxID=3154656 RepID=UPI00333196E6